LDWRAIGWRAWARPREFTAPQLQKTIEFGLIGLIGLGALGLAWAVLAPTARDDGAASAPARFDATPNAFASFDPFFRLARGSGQPGVVTSLNLTLHGIRTDRFSGRGSAIIGLPDGTQNSYAVGDEIVPGAVLATVKFDSVTIRRDGANETLYLDQSGGAAPIASVPGRPPEVDPLAAIRTGAAAPPPLISDISAEPRMREGRIDGYILKPGSVGSAFSAAGFMPGDVLMTIDGRKVGDGVGLEQLAGANKPVAVEVERNGKMLTLTVRPGA
jgi:general secretion pathway protein C